ncbi:uncharacterized protein LOC143035266 isoform X2 [Oratosquilla oratoria]|uniref:uncharacterized protein LOC143035266 isoform X2 n=1 Tax=Oratosquilla oratoria TaxID=337810 RepID=UPI003F75F685
MMVRPTWGGRVKQLEILWIMEERSEGSVEKEEEKTKTSSQEESTETHVEEQQPETTEMEEPEVETTEMEEPEVETTEMEEPEVETSGSKMDEVETTQSNMEEVETTQSKMEEVETTQSQMEEEQEEITDYKTEEPEVEEETTEEAPQVEITETRMEEAEEESIDYTSDEVYHHTWQPKGKYDLKKTEVKYEDVVPIDVPEVDIKDTQPPKAQTPPIIDQDEEGIDMGDGRDAMLGVQTNGMFTPTSPLDIPEGIPLLARILPREESGESEKITLERLFTPATDGGDLTPKRAGKVFASSAFYRPDHPTIEDQVELAQKISFSLVDENNKMSKGQSMYMRRKKRSVKWIHDEAVAASKQSGTMPGPVASEDMDDLILSQPKEKPPLKNLMSSRGVQDYTQVQERYSTLMTWAQQQPPLSGQPGSPEVQRDIIADMQSPTGKGAALFAKRKKRMDKFIVDETTVQKSSVVTESSTSSSTVTTAQQEQLVTAAAPPPLLQAGGPAAPFAAAPTAAAAKSKSSKQAKSDRDKQQEQIIEQFMKNRQQTVQIVQSPWHAALETGDPNAAFKTMTPMPIQLAETVCDQAAKIAIELPKPVPINDPLPGGPPKAALAPVKPEVQAPPPAPPPQNPLPFPTQGTPVDGGAVYTAEVKVVQRASLPSTPLFSSPAPQTHLLEQMSQADSAEKRKSFNLAAKGWGTYNTFYKPVTFQAS